MSIENWIRDLRRRWSATFGPRKYDEFYGHPRLSDLRRRWWAIVSFRKYAAEFSRRPRPSDWTLYSLVAHYQNSSRSNGSFSDIYFDTQYSFILCKNRLPLLPFVAKPVAVIGFHLCDYFEDSSSMSIEQIQGVNKNWGLIENRFRWERMLLKIAVDWARKCGLKRVEVIRAKNNRWYPKNSKPTEKEREMIARMHMRYDVTPRRMGFVVDPETGKNFLAL